VDLLIEQDNRLYPIEFKKTAIPSLSSVKNFSALKNLGRTIAPGAVVCLSETDTLLSKDIFVIPASYL
jgi:hypothetical protein